MKSLFEVYREHQGKVSDKWSIYLSEYDRIFSPYRGQSVCMLEIGIQNGGSLEVWSQYFPNAQVFVGCDINPDCARLVYEDSRIKVVVGDANTDTTETEILSHSPSFDLIIDDGSHTSGDIVKSFARYFRHLNYGGVFVAEDLHCSYWTNYEGGLYYPYSSIAFFKRLADIVNHEHWGVEKERRQLLQGFSEQFSTEFDESTLAEVHSIEFFNSVCVVHKRKAQSNVLGERFIAGRDELVVSGHHGLAEFILTPQSQSGNPWAAMKSAPEEVWEELTQLLVERDSQIASLNQVVTKRDGQITNLALGLTERNALIDALYSSSSWRVTGPLRFMVHQAKRAKRIVELARPAITRGGGLKNTLKKAMRLYQREGIAGIKRGFRVAATASQITPTVGSDIFDRNDYTEWVRRYDTLTDESRDAIRSSIEQLAVKPLISVVMPTYNPRSGWLIEAIESVRKQIYPNWELCIADDASPDQSIRLILEQYALKDSRIKVVIREKNGHISAASNSALELACGTWIALLDHDDLLPEQALFYLVEEINTNPDARLIYSDEDKISEEGHRSNPYFKPDWNIDLFYSQNLFSHLGAYDLALVKQVGGFRIGLEGAQDYDLALRCMEQIKSSQIRHIPHVLYHWRMHSESTANSNSAKPYAVVAGERALNEHFKRISVNATVESTVAGYRVNYHLPLNQPLVSVIVSADDNFKSLIRCVNSIKNNTSYKSYEIIINLTNASRNLIDSINEEVNDELFDVVIFNNSNAPLKSLDAVVSQAQGEIICFLDTAMEAIGTDWLTEMVSLAVQPEIAVVGAKLVDINNRVYSGGLLINPDGPVFIAHSHQGINCQDHGYFGRASLRQNYSAVSALCMVLKKEIYMDFRSMDAGKIDESINWLDFFLRIKENGFRVVWTPFSVLRVHHVVAFNDHRGGESHKNEIINSRAFFQSGWGSSLKHDPSNSINLSNNYGDFSLAWPPKIFLH